MKEEKVAVVGGGFSGLTVAWELAKKGYQVTVFEKDRRLGGLAGGFRAKRWRWRLDYFYHHFFPSDHAFQKLIEELGLTKKTFFLHPKTSVYYQKKTFPFDSVQDVLSFPHLSFISRLRFGAGTAFLKYFPYLPFYEKVRTEKALRILVGRQAYDKIWHPLLSQKFSFWAKKLPLSWFWARVKTRKTNLGYFRGGFSKLANLLAAKIKEKEGKIKRDFPVLKIKKIQKSFLVEGKGKTYSFDKVVLAVPLPVALRIGKELLQKEQERFSQLKTLGAAALILRLKERFFSDNTYWLNVLEKDWPFVAVVEHTNFIDRRQYGGEIIVYLGGYYPQTHPIFSMDKEAVLKKFLPFARKINPKAKKNLIDYHFFTSLYAQPLPVLGYSKVAPKFKTSVPGLYWLSTHHIYPHDRGTNFAVGYAKKLTETYFK